MSIPTNISKNRLKFTDDENKVFVKDLSELIDSTPVNDAKAALQDVSETALAKFADMSALKSLQDPLSAVSDSLSSGDAAAKMLASMGEKVQTALPDMRAVSATVTNVINSGQAQASNLTQSLMGSINQSLAQVPATIGKVDQLSSEVKGYLLKNSVAEYARAGLGVVSQTVASATAALQTTNALRQGFDQAKQSVLAAKQRFAPNVYPQTPNLPQVTSQSNSQRIMETLYNPAGTVVTEVGTTSQLLPVSSPDGVSPSAPEPTVSLTYNNHALLVLMGGVTWYRSLYTYMFKELQLTHLAHTYGLAQDHYAMLSLQGTELQDEQLRNFQSLITANTPDNPSKNLFVYNQFQTVLAYLEQDLPTLPDKSRVYAVLAYLGQLLPVIPLKDLVTESDYNRLSNQVARDVVTASDDTYSELSAEEFSQICQDSFKLLVTDAIVAHRGQNQNDGSVKFAESSSSIALYCGVWLMRELLLGWIKTTDPQARERLVIALSTVYNTQIDRMEFAYTDFHELVQQGLPVYYQPNTKAFSQLGFVFIKHYHLNRTEIFKSRQHLLQDEEKMAFDALTMRLDALIENPLPQLQAILEVDTPFSSIGLSEELLELGRVFSHAMISNRRLVLDAFSFPPHTFERYSASVEQLYYDNNVAVMR